MCRQTTTLSGVRLSIRNQLTGTIVGVDIGAVMATVKVRLDGSEQIITSSITKDAAEVLGLQPGMPATVFMKSTDVSIGVE
ncbi:molybdopterin-binding protein [Mycobacterium sp. OTB74]|nr:molybdopterin-binding protein [Mycobacterium sp. OTB74]